MNGGGLMRQHTIAEKISCTGIGLHGGQLVHLSLFPARAGTGVVFVRTDLEPRAEIAAHSANVSATRFATTLASGGARMQTVEHLLAAAYGLGVDNLRVEVDGPELPVLDGSAASFTYLIHCAGRLAQPEVRPVLRVRRLIEVRSGSSRIAVAPARGLRVSYAVDFSHRDIGRQEFELDADDPAAFEREIASARTFGFLDEVEAMRRTGFARGGSLDNAVILDADGVLNPEGLRWPDEFVRHKVLDLLGDLATLGMRLVGHVRVERGGHSLHHALVRAIHADPDAWRVHEPGRFPGGFALASLGARQ
ncbi:MAG: UDP-3-O-acyl-N-acetylglucosamine deacetylase [Myxococcales bacterium]|nr:UDP-3-O-acyl-N-acetylglucosamine deacetylase [Myxococcales bacterium]